MSRTGQLPPPGVHFRPLEILVLRHLRILRNVEASLLIFDLRHLRLFTLRDVGGPLGLPILRDVGVVTGFLRLKLLVLRLGDVVRLPSSATLWWPPIPPPSRKNRQ